MRRRIGFAVCGLLILAGCGDDLPNPTSGPGRTTTATATSERTSTKPEVTTQEATTTPAAPTTTTPPNQLALGQTFTNPTTGTTATAFQVVRPGAPNAPASEPANTEWAALDVEVCVGPRAPADSYITGQVWKLRDANNGQFDRSSIGYNQFPTPEYPHEQAVVPGECFRGWIVFSVIVGVPLTAVEYRPDGLQSFPRWPLSG